MGGVLIGYCGSSFVCNDVDWFDENIPENVAKNRLLAH